MGLYHDFLRSFLKEKKNTLEDDAPAPPRSKESKPACKICCACPNERRVRDECLLLNASLEDCREHVDAFYACLLQEGFTQDDVDKLRRNSRF